MDLKKKFSLNNTTGIFFRTTVEDAYYAKMNHSFHVSIEIPTTADKYLKERIIKQRIMRAIETHKQGINTIAYQAKEEKQLLGFQRYKITPLQLSQRSIDRLHERNTRRRVNNQIANGLYQTL